MVNAELDVGFGEFPFIDAIVNDIRPCLADINQTPIGNQECSFQSARLKACGTTGNVDPRAVLHHNRLTRADRHSATGDRELADSALDQIRETGNIGQWGTHPCITLIDSSIADVDLDGGVAKDSRALERGIRQLGPAEVHGDDVLGNRRHDIRRAGNIDQRTFIEIYLARGCDEFAERIRASRIEPFPGADIHQGIWCQQNRVLADVDRLTRKVDFGTKRQLCANRGLLAVKFRENAHDTPLAQRHDAGILIDERRIAGGA